MITIKDDGFILFKDGGQGWIRTSVHLREQIYSLPPLTTRPPTHLRIEPPSFGVGWK